MTLEEQNVSVTALLITIFMKLEFVKFDLHCRQLSSHHRILSFISDHLSRHYSDVIMSAMAPQITGVPFVCSNTDQIKHQSSASLAFVRAIHRWPVNSPHKGPVTRKMFPFAYVIMIYRGQLRKAAHKNKARHIPTMQATRRVPLMASQCHLCSVFTTASYVTSG